MISRLLTAIAATLLGACNMVLSEAPIFSEEDRAGFAPKDGIWIAQDDECGFDSALPEASWPSCAMWVVVRGAELRLLDGKGQAEQVQGFFAAGDPAIMQLRWIDTAKDSRAYYGFYGLEAQDVGSDSRFSAASTWGVECGVQDSRGSDIKPFPGISPECRPTSKESIRSAARLSRRPDQIKEWRWLRAEAEPN